MKFFASLLVGIAALPRAIVAFPDFTGLNVLKARQTPGTPEYDCHNSCGSVIAQARIEPSTQYCFSSKFVTNLNNCLACANTYNIWSTYSTSVTRAAVACGIQPSLQPSGQTSLTTTYTANPTAASAVGGAGGGLASSSSSGSSSSASARGTASITGSLSSVTPLNTASPTAPASVSTSRTSAPAVQSSAGAIRNAAAVQGAVWLGVLGLIL